MSDAVSGNSGVEEEFLWTCTLTGADKVYDWSPEVGTWSELLICHYSFFSSGLFDINLFPQDPIVSKDDEETEPEVKPGHK